MNAEASSRYHNLSVSAVFAIPVAIAVAVTVTADADVG